jgi:hypothetical protein
MRVPRIGILPPRLAGLVVLGAAVVPILIKGAKPIARKVANGLIRTGEKLRDTVAENEGTQAGPEAPNETMSEDSRRSTSATTAGSPDKDTSDIDAPAPPAETAKAAKKTISPTGQEEVSSRKAAVMKGDAEVADSPPVKKRRKQQQPEPDQPLNPKKTARVPPKNPRKARKKAE